jgi:hypothetical protein|tara:strand:- start:4178 stop:5740 length:1563 start_codon:yes stop_codon:yes gene_type:complete
MYRPYVRDQSGTIAALMQQMSQSKRSHDLEMLDASPRKLDFFGQVTQGAYDSYLAAKAQEKIDADRELNREEQRERIDASRRAAESLIREEQQADDLRAIDDLSGYKLSELRRMAKGQLETTHWEPSVNESGDISVQPGRTLPAEAPSRPDLETMGGGFGLRVRPRVKGGPTVLTKIPTFKDQNPITPLQQAKLDAELEALAIQKAEGAQSASQPQQGPDNTTTVFNTGTGSWETVLDAQGNPRPWSTVKNDSSKLSYDQLSGITEQNLLSAFGSIGMGEQPTYTANDAIAALSAFDQIDSESFIRTVHEKSVRNRASRLISAWLDTDEGKKSLADWSFGSGRDAEDYMPPESQLTVALNQARLDIPISQFLAGGAITREVEAPVTATPNLREIVEMRLQPGGNVGLEPSVETFLRDYPGLSEKDAVDLYEEVYKAEIAINKSIKEELEVVPMLQERGWDAVGERLNRNSSLLGGGPRVLTREEKHEDALSEYRKGIETREQTEKVTRDAIDRYFAALLQ